MAYVGDGARMPGVALRPADEGPSPPAYSGRTRTVYSVAFANPVMAPEPHVQPGVRRLPAPCSSLPDFHPMMVPAAS